MKHRAILASFLFYAQRIGVGQFLNWPSGSTSQDTIGFSFYPATGGHTNRAVRDKLIEASYLTERGDLPSALLDMTMREANAAMGFNNHGRVRTVKSYRINNKPLLTDARLQSATFIDANRPEVLVNKAEEPDVRFKRKQDGDSTPRLDYKAVYKFKLGSDASKAARTVKDMNSFWVKHPLTLPATNTTPAQYFASATRIFHNGDIKSGGRWYGGWTSMPNKESQRLSLQIDGGAVCEIDLNASQPSLFSALVGIKMNVGDTWTDAYQAVVDKLTLDEDTKVLRSKVKQVIVEMTGSGNSQRKGPAKNSEDNLFNETEGSLLQYDTIRLAALEVMPALHKLNRSYLNATGFLSFHEANMLTETLLQLKKMGIVAYGVHDCVIVKCSCKDEAIDTYRDIIRNYVLKVQKKSGVPEVVTDVALSVEELGSDKVKLSGSYK
ncbi:hypothetical protein N9413_13510 [Paracoccaceae bacterium]|nr:hypothetical protein [Paracoccaceae bacterium]